MSFIKLNRKRSYGIVSGHAEIAFAQDGLYFRGDGSLIEDPPKEAPAPLITNSPVHTPDQDHEAEIAERNRRRGESMKRIWAARREAKK